MKSAPTNLSTLDEGVGALSKRKLVDPQFIYIMSARFGATAPRSKIGYSSDPYKRAQAVNQGSPVPVVLAHFFQVPAADVQWVEREAHRRLKDKRRHGEWFACCSGIANNVLIQILTERGFMRWPSDGPIDQ